MRGLFAFPLRVGSIVLGTLELHRATAGELRRPQLSFALRSAEEMGSALLELWAAQEIPALGRPAAVVHQAAGMVMVQLDVSIEDAMARLRASAYAEGVSLVDLADDVVRRRRRFTKEQR
ncbi:MAG: ANTAR domain-containing protein [Nocardioidaceae bacterium]